MTRPVVKNIIEDSAASQQIDPFIDRFNETTKIPILQGRLIEGVSITAGTVKMIKHRLARKLRGWIIIQSDISVSNFMYDKQTDNKHQDQELWLYLDDGGTNGSYRVSLWVF